ncbi:MAG: LPS export ABC transporter ATP-binding protein [bacterium]|jgi:lipopolysaccharide export system ATP-binding protein|nr:LPS export ABC transporter ATP-binding protein [bacterium]
MSERLFRSEALVKRYGRRTVVDGVSIEVRTGEIVGLLGPNGAGKTTTFYMMTGMIRPSQGRIHLDDKDVTHMPMFRRARAGVGYLAQEASIFRKLSVEDNVMAILETMPLTRTQRRQRLEELLGDLRVSHLKRNKAYTLSGGERRRVEIARALASNPGFMLLDEPFAGVDPIAVGDIQSIVAELKARKIGVLITDHNVHETLSITDRAYLLFEGRILKSGTAEELAADEQVRRVYLGDNFRLNR